MRTAIHKVNVAVLQDHRQKRRVMNCECFNVRGATCYDGNGGVRPVDDNTRTFANLRGEARRGATLRVADVWLVPMRDRTRPGFGEIPIMEGSYDKEESLHPNRSHSLSL